MNYIKLIILLTLSYCINQMFAAEKPFPRLLEAAQQEAAYQHLHPQVGGGMWMPYSNQLRSFALNLNSRIFPENKPTNDLEQVLIDLETEKYTPAWDFNRSSNYFNSRLPDIARLLAQGADPNVSYRGRNLVTEAILYRNNQLVNLLKNAPIRARFDVKYPSGRPVWFNISSDRLEMLLRAQVIDINQQSSDDGDTALLNAIDREEIDSIRLLLRYYADPTISNKYGETAVEAAKTEELPADIIQLLQHAVDNPRKQKLP
jgi:hypothetical protein